MTEHQSGWRFWLRWVVVGLVVGFVACLAFIGLLLAIMWSGSEAHAHGKYSWIEAYQSGGTVIVSTEDKQEWLEPAGGSCCGKNDAFVISNEIADSVAVGGTITWTLHGKPVEIKVKRIYMTRDPKGRAWLTTHGCLFRRGYVQYDKSKIRANLLRTREHTWGPIPESGLAVLPTRGSVSDGEGLW